MFLQIDDETLEQKFQATLIGIFRVLGDQIQDPKFIDQKTVLELSLEFLEQKILAQSLEEKLAAGLGSRVT